MQAMNNNSYGITDANGEPQNSDMKEPINLLLQATIKLEPIFQILKRIIYFHCCACISVFYLAFVNINSNYFRSVSFLLIVFGSFFCGMCFSTLRIFRTNAPILRKKKQLIFITVISLIVSCMSASYLIDSSSLQWCGYVITYNGSVDSGVINNELQRNGVCNQSDAISITDQAYIAVVKNCRNTNGCSKSQLIMTGWIGVLISASFNIFIFFLCFMACMTYLFQRIKRISEDLNSGLGGFQPNFVSPVLPLNYQSPMYQHNQPQIYQAQILPPQYSQTETNLVFGQPVQLPQVVYYHQQQQYQPQN